MSLVIGDLSISLDGYATAPGADLEHGLGVGGEPIHAWALHPTDVDAEILRSATRATGAVIMGRNLFDFIDGPNGWSDNLGYGAGEAGRSHFVVVTSAPPQQVRLELDFQFVTGGLAAAVERAKAVAEGKNVVVMGGASVVRGCLDAGLLDRLVIHLSPVITGGGISLFDGAARRELKQIDVVVSERATHLTYAVS